MRPCVFALVAILCLHPRASATDPPPKRWAVIVGVKEYTDGLFRRLDYSTNDARLMYRLMTTRCQFPAEQVVLMVDEASDKRLLPFQRQVRAEVERVAGLAQQGDTVMIFFSGHGVPDGAGNVILATRDCEKKDAAKTGVPVAWLKAVLEKCPAKQKLLVLDCCHAGAGRGTAEAVKLAPCFEQAQGLVTLASCGSDELSREWPKVEQGLFTHFLRCGLEGAADLDSNGVVDVEELYKFVYNQVTATALKELNAGQHPQIYHGPDSNGVMPLARLDRPDAPYPIRAKKGQTWKRDLVYTERYLIYQPGEVPLAAEYRERHLQRIEVQQVDATGRPTHLAAQFLAHERKTQGHLAGRTRTMQIRGALNGRTVTHELRPNGATAFVAGDKKEYPALKSIPHPVLLDEALLPEMSLKVGDSTTDPGRLVALLEQIAPAGRFQIEGPPRITYDSTLEGGRVLVFKGQARGTCSVGVPTPTTFDAKWTLEYVPTEGRIRRMKFEAETGRVKRDKQELSLLITCEVEVGADHGRKGAFMSGD